MHNVKDQSSRITLQTLHRLQSKLEKQIEASSSPNSCYKCVSIHRSLDMDTFKWTDVHLGVLSTQTQEDASCKLPLTFEGVPVRPYQVSDKHLPMLLHRAHF